jgi:hypothetical protein
MHVQSRSLQYRVASGRRSHKDGTADMGAPTTNEIDKSATTGDDVHGVVTIMLHVCETLFGTSSARILAVRIAMAFQKYGHGHFNFTSVEQTNNLPTDTLYTTPTRTISVLNSSTTLRISDTQLETFSSLVVDKT